MASTPTPRITESVMLDTLMNYLVSTARTVESAMNRALDAIVSLDNPAPPLSRVKCFYSSRASTKWKSSLMSTPSGCFAKVLFPKMNCA